MKPSTIHQNQPESNPDEPTQETTTATSSSSAVTRLLLDWRDGKEEALAQLTPIVYDELRRLAQHYMQNERHHHVLQATALVHEAYLRLIGMEDTIAAG